MSIWHYRLTSSFINYQRNKLPISLLWIYVWSLRRIHFPKNISIRRKYREFARICNSFLSRVNTIIPSQYARSFELFSIVIACLIMICTLCTGVVYTSGRVAITGSIDRFNSAITREQTAIESGERSADKSYGCLNADRRLLSPRREQAKK